VTHDHQYKSTAQLAKHREILISLMSQYIFKIKYQIIIYYFNILPTILQGYGTHQLQTMEEEKQNLSQAENARRHKQHRSKPEKA
jgi:hypothetical protein